MRILDVLKPWYVFRDAGTGHYVSRAYALLHPGTTVRERMNPKPRKQAEPAPEPVAPAAPEPERLPPLPLDPTAPPVL